MVDVAGSWLKSSMDPMKCLERHRRRQRDSRRGLRCGYLLLLLQTAFLMSISRCINASSSLTPFNTLTSLRGGGIQELPRSNRRMDASSLLQNRGGSAEAVTQKQSDEGEYEYYYSAVNGERIAAEGKYSKYVKFSQGGEVNNEPKKAAKNDIKQMKIASLLSIAFHIINQTINVATAGFVASGYFGASSATIMIRKLNEVLSKLPSVLVDDPEKLSILTNEKYQLTSLTTLGYLLLHTLGILSNEPVSLTSDISFLSILWSYSKIVNAQVGGFIGCTHLTLSIVSLLLGNRRLINALDNLGNMRYQKLDHDPKYVDPTSEERVIQYIDPTKVKRVSREPVVLVSGQSNQVTAILAKVLNALSLLIAWPQLFMGVYMIGCILVSFERHYWLKNVGQFIHWLGGGIGSSGSLGTMSIRKVSNRLVALYWVIGITKSWLHMGGLMNSKFLLACVGAMYTFNYVVRDVHKRNAVKQASGIMISTFL